MLKLLASLRIYLADDPPSISGTAPSSPLSARIQTNQRVVHELAASGPADDVSIRKSEATILLRDVADLEHGGYLHMPDQAFVDDLQARVKSDPSYVPTAAEIAQLDIAVVSAMGEIDTPHNIAEVRVELYQTLAANRKALDTLAAQPQTPEVRQAQAVRLLTDLAAVDKAGFLLPEETRSLHFIQAEVRNAPDYIPDPAVLHRLDEIAKQSMPRLIPPPSQVSLPYNAVTAAAREQRWAAADAERTSRDLLADPLTPTAHVAEILMRDGVLAPDEIEALRDRVTPGKATAQDLAKVFQAAGMSETASGNLAGWIATPNDDRFRKTFGLDGNFPITVDLHPGAAGLEIASKSHADDSHTGTTMKSITVEVKGLHPTGIGVSPTGDHELDPLRGPYTVSSQPVPVKYKFDGLPTPVTDELAYTVTVRGKDIQVVVPKAPLSPPRDQLPTPDQVGRAMALLPKEDIDAVTTVVLEPYPHPDETGAEAYLGCVYDATPQVIHFFPQDSAWSQGGLDSTMLHEAAHAVAIQLAATVDQKTWQAAAANDGISPSSYADSGSKTSESWEENVAEVATLYLMGGRDDLATRSLYPFQFALLDSVYPDRTNVMPSPAAAPQAAPPAKPSGP